MEKIKKHIKKILFGCRADSDSYVAYLRSLGMKIGNRVVIFSPRNVVIDEQRPWLIEIGDDVQIPYGVVIETHGYDWSVIKRKYGDVLGSSGEVKIGNNVFIGMNTTILKGAHIGNNVIIGAGSLVNKDIPDNSVAAGVPAKVIMSLDDYYKKRCNAQLVEAIELVEKYRERYGKNPGEEHLKEFFWLFENEPNNLPESWREIQRLVGNEAESNKKLSKHKKHFESMDVFLDSIN